jgi:hypothetical protein
MAEPTPLQPAAVSAAASANAPLQHRAAPSRRNRWLSWLALFLVGTASISLAAVYLPPRVKMLGLFAVGLGLLAGWLAARLAWVFELPAASAIGCGVVFLVILGGQVGMAFESHRLYREAEQRALKEHPKRAAALSLLQSVKLPDDAKSKQTDADLRKTIGVRGTSFADYLQFRVSDLGIESRRGALVIWIVEVALGSLAGSWIFRRLAPAERLDAPEQPAKLDA